MEKQQNEMKKRENRRKQQRYLQKRMGMTLALLLVITGVGVAAAVMAANSKKDKEQNKGTVETIADPAADEVKNKPEQPEETGEPEPQDDSALILKEADLLAMGYDYDGAIEKIKSYEGYESVSEMTAAIEDYETRKGECVPVNVSEITHVFYHTLVVDPEKAFANQENDPQAVGNNQWMTTIDEFNKITQTMYDEGYVLVDLHDIAEETVDENGVSHFKEGTIMLPPGKKAFVLSLDDLSYYHSYDGYGYASKMVLDENGRPKCEYVQDDGTTVVGDFDAVPLLDKFIEEHPDAAYKGARGTIALTGYNGILGYRTDIS